MISPTKSIPWVVHGNLYDPITAMSYFHPKLEFTKDKIHLFACLNLTSKGGWGYSPPNLVFNLEMVESYHAKASDDPQRIRWPCGVFGHATTVHATTRGLNSNSARYSTRCAWWKYYVTNKKQPEETYWTKMFSFQSRNSRAKKKQRDTSDSE